MAKNPNPIAYLYQLSMQRDLERPEFIQKSEVGPAHEKTFTFECKFRWHTEMRTANSKKAAKTLAAQAVVDKLEEDLLPEEPTYQAKLEAKMKKENIKKEKEEIKKEMAKTEIRNSSLYKLSRSNKDLIESSNSATENFKFIQGSNLNSVKEQFGDNTILQDDEDLNLRQKPQSPARSSQSSGSVRSRRRASRPISSSSPSSKRSRTPVKRVKKSRYSRTRTFSSSSSSSSSSDPPPRRRRPPPIRRRSRSRTPPINSRRRPRSRSPRKRSYSRSARKRSYSRSSRKKSRSRSPILPKSKRSLSRSSSLRSHSRSPSRRSRARSPSSPPPRSRFTLPPPGHRDHVTLPEPPPPIRLPTVATVPGTSRPRSRSRSPSSPPPWSPFTLPPPGYRDHVNLPEPPPPIRPPALATVPGTSRPRFLMDIPTYSPSPLTPAGPANIVGASGRPRSLMNIPTFAPFINDSRNPFSIPPPNLNSSSQTLVPNRLEEEIVEAEKKRQISQSTVASRKDPRLNQNASLPMKKFIAVRKDLFNESLPNPQTPEVPPVPLALMVPPPQNLGNIKIVEADETQINPNDYQFEIDTTHIKLEIKTEVKVEKE